MPRSPTKTMRLSPKRWSRSRRTSGTVLDHPARVAQRVFARAPHFRDGVRPILERRRYVWDRALSTDLPNRTRAMTRNLRRLVRAWLLLMVLLGLEFGPNFLGA